MSPDRPAVATVVLECLHRYGEDLDIPALQQADEQTRLFGAKSGVDSMQLVGLIADVEEAVADAFGANVVLADERAMSRTHSPFRRAESLIDYVLEQLTAEAD